MNWKDIETAPKDGTRVLVFSGDWIAIAYWKSDAQIWCVWDCEDYFPSVHLVGDDAPTHWMPLPEPPK